VVRLLDGRAKFPALPGAWRQLAAARRRQRFAVGDGAQPPPDLIVGADIPVVIDSNQFVGWIASTYPVTTAQRSSSTTQPRCRP
jgi:hypothetical protein